MAPAIFRPVGDGYGDGYGFGYGDGNGYGFGYGFGYGDGDGTVGNSLGLVGAARGLKIVEVGHDQRSDRGRCESDGEVAGMGH